MVHSDNRLAAAITMTLFATGIAASVLIILSHDRPFTGEVAVGPAPLLQVIPDVSSAPAKSSSANSALRPPASKYTGRVPALPNATSLLAKIPLGESHLT
jgi:hypothetical protein